MLLSFVTMPSATTTFNEASQWSSALWDNSYNVLIVIIGILIFGWIVNMILGALRSKLG